MKKYFPYILIIIFIAGVVGYNMYNKDHKETKDATSDVVISPKELLAIYEQDEVAADAKYLDKIIEVKGVVKEINNVGNGGSISLDTESEMASIICEFESAAAFSNIKVGDEVTVKGFCTGKLMDIVLARCSLK
jgi:hypothetical protein